MSTRQDGPALAGGQDTSTNTIRPVPIDHATGALLVTGSGGSGGSVTQGTVPWVVSGSVTANAGTNLNTSALALESGGNLATAAATLGATTGAAVTTDANGTIQQYLRGLVKLAITAGSFLVTAALSAGTNIIGGVRRAGYQNAVWTTTHFPAANTQATITRASAGGGLKNVAIGFVVSIVGQTTAPAAIQLTWKLIDGASGGGTILDGAVVGLPAVGGSNVTVLRSNIYIPGTANTAMTLEFSAAGGANTIQSVSLQGTTE